MSVLHGIENKCLCRYISFIGNVNVGLMSTYKSQFRAGLFVLEEIIALPILGGQTVVCSSAKWNLTDFLLDRSLLGLSIDLLGEKFMELLRKKSME